MDERRPPMEEINANAEEQGPGNMFDGCLVLLAFVVLRCSLLSRMVPNQLSCRSAFAFVVCVFSFQCLTSAESVSRFWCKDRHATSKKA